VTIEAADKKHGMTPDEIRSALTGIDERAQVKARTGWGGQLAALIVLQPMD
jgi:hypothetical protein